jgi:very-short-patch-repair endonuclease
LKEKVAQRDFLPLQGEGQDGDGVEAMLGQISRKAKDSSIRLRKTMTDAERKLWSRLRSEQLGVKFRRQHPFLCYVLDFVCLERKLVIEVDGSQHMEIRQQDEARSIRLNEAGFVVLRFWNNEVLNETDAVVEKILEVLQTPSLPRPSP